MVGVVRCAACGEQIIVLLSHGSATATAHYGMFCHVGWHQQHQCATGHYQNQ